MDCPRDLRLTGAARYPAAEEIELRRPPVVIAVPGRCGSYKPLAIREPVIFINEQVGRCCPLQRAVIENGDTLFRRYFVQVSGDMKTVVDRLGRRDTGKVTVQIENDIIETLKEIPDALRFIDEAYKHGKAIAASSEGIELVKQTKTGTLVTNEDAAEEGVLFADNANRLAPDFIAAIANHRFHHRHVDQIMA